MAQFRDLVLRIKTLGLDKDLKLDTITDQNLEDIDDYLKEIEENKTPFGLHTFGVSPDEAYTKATTEAIVSMQKDLMGKDLELFREQVQKNIAKSGKEELDAFIRALNGKYVRQEQETTRSGIRVLCLQVKTFLLSIRD